MVSKQRKTVEEIINVERKAIYYVKVKQARKLI